MQMDGEHKKEIEMSNDYLKKRLEYINAGRPLKGRETPKAIKPVSDKRAAKLAEQKKELDGDDPAIQKFYKARRIEMVGVCQCGCARNSSKNDDLNFRSSVAHIFPKAIFLSVALHPLNWVERNFWDGCHTNMDQRGLDKWPNMADWDDIREKFFVLAPLLTDEERATKFYQKLEALVYGKSVTTNK